MLFFPEGLVQKSPVRPLQTLKISISQEVNQRAVFVDRCAKTKNAQDSLRPEGQRYVEPHPKRVSTENLRPVEVHAALALTFDDESISRARHAHVVLECAARKRERLAMQEDAMHGIGEVLENQNPVGVPA